MWHNAMNKKLNKLLLLHCCWAHSQLILNQIKSFSVPVPVLLSFFAAHLLAGWTLAEQWLSTLHTSSEQAYDTGTGKFIHWAILLWWVTSVGRRMTNIFHLVRVFPEWHLYSSTCRTFLPIFEPNCRESCVCVLCYVIWKMFNNQGKEADAGLPLSKDSCNLQSPR